MFYILLLAKAKLSSVDISNWRIRKRSIDARRKPIKINLQVEFWLQNEQRESIPAIYSPRGIQ